GWRPAGWVVGTDSASVTVPLVSGKSGSRAGCAVTHSRGMPMTLALTPSITSSVLTTSRTTAVLLPGSTAKCRESATTRITSVPLARGRQGITPQATVPLRLPSPSGPPPPRSEANVLGGGPIPLWPPADSQSFTTCGWLATPAWSLGDRPRRTPLDAGHKRRFRHPAECVRGHRGL